MFRLLCWRKDPGDAGTGRNSMAGKTGLTVLNSGGGRTAADRSHGDGASAGQANAACRVESSGIGNILLFEFIHAVNNGGQAGHRNDGRDN